LNTVQAVLIQKALTAAGIELRTSTIGEIKEKQETSQPLHHTAIAIP
jgi:hypothetical protein